nr:MAG TPA: hypothetical protein [Caudoviricetes sp.]
MTSINAREYHGSPSFDPRGAVNTRQPPPKSRPTFDFLRGYISIWVLACPSPISSHACFSLLSRRGLGQAKTQIEVLERMRNGKKED